MNHGGVFYKNKTRGGEHECNISYGHVLKGARKTVRLDKNDAAKMFGISAKELRSYEQGSALISDSVLTRLFTYGYMLRLPVKILKEKNKIVNKFRVVGWLIGMGLNATVRHSGHRHRNAVRSLCCG